MKFAVHTVLLLAIFYTLLLAIFYTNLTIAQNLDPIQIAPNIPSSYESYYGSENEVISDGDELQNDYTSGQVFSSDIQGFNAENPPDGMMCTNVSMWGAVYWTAENVTECKCEIEKMEETKMEQVCMNITSMDCTLELNLKCTKTNNNESHTESEWIQEMYNTTHCTEERKTVWHNKTAVECNKIPTYYCDSIWEIQEDGTKVWVGNNQCDYYEWEDCQIVYKNVSFEEPYISCDEEGVIPFQKLENVTRWTNLENETCEIVNCVQCVPKIKEFCVEINVTKTYQVINENCAMVQNMVPKQDFEHIERCFFNQTCPPGEGIIDPENDDRCGPCPDKQGILPDEHCGDCPQGQGIDSLSKVCGICLDGQGILQTGICGACLNGEGIDSLNDNQCGPCPKEQGILQTGICGACPNGEGIDPMNGNQCGPCPDGQTPDPVTNICTES